MSEIQIGIIMGSDSDLPRMQKFADTVVQFNVGWETVVSRAYRHLENTAHYACSAAHPLGRHKRLEQGEEQ